MRWPGFSGAKDGEGAFLQDLQVGDQRHAVEDRPRYFIDDGDAA